MDREQIDEIAKLVKQHRLEKEYTQQELSDLAGISLRSIQRIENAEVLPRQYTLKILTKHLEFTLENKEPEKQAPARKPLSRAQKIVLSISVALLLVVLACAFIFQSAHFPETAFEMALFIAGVMVLYTLILMRIWR
jgi:transcriptional regulator with XRE-family HTH domain